jgi:hypothetical protein
VHLLVNSKEKVIEALQVAIFSIGFPSHAAKLLLVQQEVLSPTIWLACGKAEYIGNSQQLMTDSDRAAERR